MEKKWQPISVLMPEKLHGEGARRYSPKCHKEMDMTEQLSTYVIHFSFLFYVLLRKDKITFHNKKEIPTFYKFSHFNAFFKCLEIIYMLFPSPFIS